MNREIIFRGKDFLKEEWVYGDLVKTKNFVAIKRTNGDYFHPTQVSPNTVGQYTGLKDCNGNKIFEGDILQDEHDSKIMHIVRYDDSICSYTAWCPLVHDNWEKGNMISKKWINEFGKIVIGNVTDNPEMVKGGEK